MDVDVKVFFEMFMPDLVISSVLTAFSSFHSVKDNNDLLLCYAVLDTLESILSVFIQILKYR